MPESRVVDGPAPREEKEPDNDVRTSGTAGEPDEVPCVEVELPEVEDGCVPGLGPSVGRPRRVPSTHTPDGRGRLPVSGFPVGKRPVPVRKDPVDRPLLERGRLFGGFGVEFPGRGPLSPVELGRQTHRPPPPRGTVEAGPSTRYRERGGFSRRR